ncbi:MAG: 3-hydroxyacyl-ACP dehydratase FabZ [Geothrix sp.]|jgi:beta-hydroxyacyl-ACP dehydratase FabZ|uniref:3-hydroxyacyl-[acyl-carrier-protein] dehydratase FabZ n=1 Tax=Candidatus Geothrix odensensis TaxID=2954440 RepID=A0A936F165_9BACT|nr:3-hydroxyacyl-ACP dehydratase FabZ [Holophagaceae bacterium]MBK8571690.1 3-hydroxyacyl-ACP dehydratase FabZ [Candidatus Geothrix odensensis]MBK8788770.1 3-hydroxyacyl-ACP dehydratase FabZ [Holophagaceae bacterium]MBP7617081.1 3-hydroxyacyl-ACP dehydratase FabZ [Geothrix sp.]MCC6513575.1 3-hydroxyacyl-ACP dehydratase FabZ [Geothrix sp.]
MSEREPRTIDLQGIMDLLPHRYPILLVDRILDFEPKEWIRGLKNVSFNEAVFQGHFPSRPVFPGVYIVEAMAQTGGCLLMREFEDRARKVIYFMGIDGVRFRKPVLPGDQLVMEVKVIQFKGRICKMRGEAFVDGQKVAEAEFMSMLMDLAEGEGQ